MTRCPPGRRRGRSERWEGSERGSGTVLVLGLVTVVLVLMVAVSLLVRAQVGRAGAQTAADLAALAAAERLMVGSGATGGPGSACETARRVAAANGARLARCIADDQGVVRVVAVRDGGVGDARATARAGPATSRPRRARHEPPRRPTPQRGA